MIPDSILYDEYIGRRKLTEQKKPFEYIVPPPSRGVGTIRRYLLLIVPANEYDKTSCVICFL